MNNSSSFFDELPDADVSQIRKLVEIKKYNKGNLIFSEGDEGDLFYIVEKGNISIYFHDANTKVQVNSHDKGGYFGEMGILNNDKRAYSAEATEDTTLLCLNKNNFLQILESYPEIAEKVKQVLSQRNEELILRETLINTTGVNSNNLYISIKGDPSLRETALFRERYESPVDKIIGQLKNNLEDLLLNKCVYQINVYFNSGEIHLFTVFDPFREKIHLAETLTDQAFIDRHFINMTYEDKSSFIKNIYGFISTQPQYKALPAQWKSIFNKTADNWEPLPKDEIRKVMGKLDELRSVPNFYLRNFSINTIQDTIRLQFNCDGTHIVNSSDYGSFLDKNFSI